MESFFTAYLDGLTTMVGRGRGVTEPVPSKVELEQSADGGLQGKATLLDCFVTLEPMELRLKVVPSFTEGRTEIFVQASPKEFTDPIWDVLAREVTRIELPSESD